MSLSSTLVKVKCPTCQKLVPWQSDQAFRPFCSERCKLIDLGEWIMEEKRIPGEHSEELDVETPFNWH